MSFRINAVAVKRMAQRCAEAGAKLVHFSTNYVFDGRRERAVRRGRPALAALDLRDLEARRRVRGARLRRRRARRARRRPLRAARQRPEGRQLRHADARRGRARASRSGWSPTSACSRRSRATWRRRVIEAVERDADGRAAPDRRRRLLVARVHGGDLRDRRRRRADRGGHDLAGRRRPAAQRRARPAARRRARPDAAARLARRRSRTTCSGRGYSAVAT